MRLPSEGRKGADSGPPLRPDITETEAHLDAITCKRCRREIEWFRTARRGLPMPLDLGEDERGNAVVRDGLIHVLKRNEQLELGDVVRMPHAATCGKTQCGRCARWIKR